MTLTAPPAGWYHQRLDPEVLRYWDGNGWTDQLRRVPTPGWYPHPEDPNRPRYWNGSTWTDAAAPTPSVPASVAAAQGPTTLAPPAPAPAGPTPVPSAPVAPPTTAPPTVAAAPVAPPPVAPPPVAPPPVAPPPVAPPPVAPPPVAEPAPASAPSGFKEGPAEAVARLRATPVASPEQKDVASVEPVKEEERRGRSPILFAVEAIVLLAVVVAGGYLLVTKSGLNLGGGSAAPTAVAAPAGYHTVSLPSTGLSFAVPNTWLGVDTSSPTFQQNLQAFMAAHPTLCSDCSGTSGVSAATTNIRYLAADQSNPTYQSNVEVVSLGVTRDALTNAVAAQDAFRREIPNAVVAPATIAGTRALSLTGTIDVPLPTGSHVTVYATGYVVGTSRGVYWVTLNTTDPGSQDAVVQTAFHTLQLES